MTPFSSDNDCIVASHMVVRFSRLAVISFFSCGARWSISVNSNNIVCLKREIPSAKKQMPKVQGPVVQN